MKTISALVFALTLLGACAEAQTAQTPAQAAQAAPSYVVITPGASFRLADVQTEQWAPDNSILVTTQRGDWYRATLMGGCSDKGLGLISIASRGVIVDRGASAIVGGQSCQLASIDKIEPPPGHRGRH